MVRDAVRELVADHVVRGRESLAVDHLLPVPEGIPIRTRFVGEAVAHRRLQRHAGAVDAVATEREEKVVGVAGVVVGVVHVLHEVGNVTLAADRRGAWVLRGSVAAVADLAVFRVFDLIDAKRHRAELGIDENQLVEREPLLAPDVEPPDQRRTFGPGPAEDSRVVDPQSGLGGLETHRHYPMILCDRRDSGLPGGRGSDPRSRRHGRGRQRFAAHREHVAGGVQVHDQLAANDRHIIEELLEPNCRSACRSRLGGGHAQLACLIADPEDGAVAHEEGTRDLRSRRRGAKAERPRDRPARGGPDEPHLAGLVVERDARDALEPLEGRLVSLHVGGHTGFRGSRCPGRND